MSIFKFQIVDTWGVLGLKTRLDAQSTFRHICDSTAFLILEKNFGIDTVANMERDISELL